MLKLSIEAIIDKINNDRYFEAVADDGSFYIKVKEYTPFACFAIHDGHNLRPELISKCNLSDFERWQEEDPFTYEFISSFPIIMAGRDSRYEYDLNRRPEEAIYKEAWGKKVWKEPLTRDEINLSITKHNNFYLVLKALLEKLENRFSSVLLFDIHSFNYKRLPDSAPMFNLGTEKISNSRFRKILDYFLKELARIHLPNVNVNVAENDVFKGNGYFLDYSMNLSPAILTLATEIKKVYCDEENGETFPVIIEKISNQLKKVIINTAANFARKQTNLTVVKKNSLLSGELDKDLQEVDKRLFEIARNFEVLNYVNPVNIDSEKKRFFRLKYAENPVFRYKQLVVNPFAFKKELYNLPVEKIKDISIRVLYQDVINSYADKVDIISSIGSERFLYNSLRYFGEPGINDIENAEYLLHFPQTNNHSGNNHLDAHDVKNFLKNTLKDYGFDCRIEISNQVIAKVLILNSKKLIRIRKNTLFEEKFMNALAEHEIGVHMLTTVNSRSQPLKVFRLGTPVNTHTQEGLAVLSEYLSGNLDVSRLQTLALRVLVISKLLKGYDFKRTFEFLMDLGKIDENQAFYMTARIFRGGGFTKDYLYLKGFRDILRMYQDGTNFESLLIGKTSIKYKSLIEELIDRKILLPPMFRTKSLLNPVPADPLTDYLLKGLY